MTPELEELPSLLFNYGSSVWLLSLGLSLAAASEFVAHT